MNHIANTRIQELLSAFNRNRIIVLGDVMLDEYWWGSVDRISPEAPVPVVSVERSSVSLGGAANVAKNIAALGGQPILLGVVGEDRGHERLAAQMSDEHVPTDTLVVDRLRPTTVKTRVVAHNQHVVRADFESTDEISSDLVSQLTSRVMDFLGEAVGIVISDYGKGVVVPALLEPIIEAARSAGKFVAVDPKDTHFFSYRRATTLTPNHHEAGFVAGRRIRDEVTLHEVGFDLLQRLEADSLLVTRGEKGMALFESPDRMTLIPTAATEVYDVTGAGDTVVATVAMVLGAGGNLVEAARIANVAAGIVIREVGTAAPDFDELSHALLSTVPGKSSARQNS